MAQIAERFKVSHYFVFFLIHSAQVGIGVLGFQRYIVKDAGKDAWIAVILSGVFSHLFVWMIYKILKGTKGNLYDFHQNIFGQWLGNFLNLLFVIYFLILAANIVRTYMEIIQVWMFPTINKWVYTLIIAFLVYYVLKGGFRVLTGISFFSIILPAYIILMFIFPLQFTHWNTLLPILTHSLSDLWEATKSMSLTILGFETLLIFYPFIKNIEKSKKWAHIAIFVTTTLYTVIMLITIAFFAKGQLEKNIWATLTMWKIIELPFVERFEYIGIASWNVVILPNICLMAWCASRGIKQISKMKLKYTIVLSVLVIYFVSNMLQTRQEIDVLNTYIGQAGFYLLYLYIPFLFIVSLISRKWKGRSL